MNNHFSAEGYVEKWGRDPPGEQVRRSQDVNFCRCRRLRGIEKSHAGDGISFAVQLLTELQDVQAASGEVCSSERTRRGTIFHRFVRVIMGEPAPICES